MTGLTTCSCFQFEIHHAVLKASLDPIRTLFDDVKRKALMRLEYEGLHKADAIVTPGTRFHNDPAGFAMDRYAYYVCFKCEYCSKYEYCFKYEYLPVLQASTASATPFLRETCGGGRNLGGRSGL